MNMYYVFVERFEPVNTKGVERWSLEQIKHFIELEQTVRKSENKGLTFATKYCKIFITDDMETLALDDKNVIDF